VFTLGFETPGKRADHFKEHVVIGGEFPGITSVLEYERLAIAFFGEIIDGVILLECVRWWNGDVVRYNTVTNEFGVARANGIIKSYYKPDPSFHSFATNLDYFLDQC
jgi:hypothetical protein